jgi:hypothetical protein
MNKEIRAGRFTSSEIYKLIKTGRGKADVFSAPGLTYIKETKLERLFNSNLSDNAYSRAIGWGNFMEAILFSEKLGTEYTISSDESKKHPDEYLGDFWAGSCDFEIPNGISEAKCYYRKKFGLYTLCLLKQDVQLLKGEFPQEYWQIISNAIIHGVEYGEAVSYMPYAKDMEMIKQYAEDPIWIDQYLKEPMWKFRFIYEEETKDLPVLENDGFFKDVNKFRFKIPQEDIQLLTERVELAIDELEDLTL